MIRSEDILVVGGNESDRELLQVALLSGGLVGRVFLVHDKDEARAYFNGEGPFADRSIYPLPGLVFVDLRAKVIEGFEVVWWLRRKPGLSTIPVVVITGASMAGDIEWAYAAGANSFVTRQASMEDFIRDVKESVTYWLGDPGLRGGSSELLL